jgi:hypothetical protein
LSVFDWKLVRELENFGFFPSFGGTDMAWFYGFTHKANKKRIGKFHQGFKQFNCILDIFWRNFWQNREDIRKF